MSLAPRSSGMGQRQAIFSRRNLWAWMVLALALAASFGAWRYVDQRDRQAAERQFELMASDLAERIHRRMLHHAQVLFGVAGLFEVDGQVSRSEFQTYFQRLRLSEHYPGILGVGFAPLLAPQQVAPFEAGVRAEGFVNFRLHPSGSRRLYSAVEYLEPLSGRNLAAFGYDMLTEPRRREAFMLAARSGQPRLSRRVRLLQETHGQVQAGVLLYVPLYRPGQALDSDEQRLAALRGVVFSPYRMGDLMAGILGRQAPQLDFSIYDGDPLSADNLLFSTRAGGESRAARLQRRLELEVFGQRWILDFASLPGFEARLQDNQDMLLLGIAISLLLFALASQLTLRREQAEALAQGMTERIREQSEALRASEERLSLVLRGSNDGWWDLDLAAGTLHASARAWEMLGYPPEEAAQELGHWRRWVADEEAELLRRTLDEALASGAESFHCEARLLHREGHPVPLLLRGLIQRDASGQPQRISGTLLDLTEHKRLERMKSEFVATVSHELRTPLTSIAGALGLVNGGAMGEVPAAMAAMLQIAQQNSQRLGHLIDDLLDMEKLGAGMMSLDLQVQPIRPLLEEALAANQGYAHKHQVSLALTEEGDHRVRVDPRRLQQVLANFLSNAVKFSPPGASVQVHCGRHGSQVRVSIIDQGPGIPYEFHRHIFAKFSQADGSDRRRQAGTGLGLAISKELIERMEGCVGFHSVPGEGAHFWFDLPAIETHHLPAPAGETEARRLLVVEDEPGIVHLLEVILSQAGYAVDSVFSADQALRRLDAGRYLAMTLDLRLNDSHGLALIHDLRRRPATRELPILVISAYCSEGRQLLSDTRHIVWLEKPFSEAQLLDALQQCLNRNAKADPRL